MTRSFNSTAPRSPKLLEPACCRALCSVDSSEAVRSGAQQSRAFEQTQPNFNRNSQAQCPTSKLTQHDHGKMPHEARAIGRRPDLDCVGLCALCSGILVVEPGKIRSGILGPGSCKPCHVGKEWLPHSLCLSLSLSVSLSLPPSPSPSLSLSLPLPPAAFVSFSLAPSTCILQRVGQCRGCKDSTSLP